MADEPAYEGTVKYADDSVVSLQCFEDRCGECPDRANHCEDGPVAPPALDGYYCEHGCDGDQAGTQHAEADPDQAKRDASAAVVTESVDGLTDARALNAVQWILSDPQWGVGMLEDIAALVRGTGRTVDNVPDPDEPGEALATWDRH